MDSSYLSKLIATCISKVSELTKIDYIVINNQLTCIRIVTQKYADIVSVSYLTS